MKDKLFYRVFLILALLCCCLPPLVLCVREDKSAAAPPSAPPETQSPEPGFDAAVTLRVLDADCGILELPLDTYLCGVLLAEVPADFAPEALKAQAVASRTFALQQSQRGKHTGADVCTDASCCQGWREVSGDIDAYRQAVAQTDGLVVTYADALIEATFFSCSGGQTESAVAVWGNDVPYLQSVVSPGEEAAPRFTESTYLSAEEFADALQSAAPDCDLSAAPDSWFGVVTRTPGGSIATAEIGGHHFTGTQLRQLLKLRSTDLDFAVEAGGIRITSWGFGHRVGLSQYGAQAMAQEGADFAEILLHYYQGTKIQRLFLSEQAQKD